MPGLVPGNRSHPRCRPGGVSTIAADFDRIARASGAPSGLDAPAREIAARVRGRRVLDVGCGMGALARAMDADEIIGIDLSTEMIRRARELTSSPAVRYEVADFMEWTPEAPLDAIVSVNALHHMPFEPALARMASMLRPGGSLHVLDLCASRPLLDLPRDLVALGVGALERWRAPRSEHLVAAWRAHAAHDVFLRYDVVEDRAEAVLPGCRVRRLLRWRYALRWVRPDAYSAIANG